MAAKVLACGLCICFLTDLVRLGKHLEWCEASHRYAKFFPVAAKCFSASLHILPYLALKCLYVALYICFLPDLLRSGKHLAYLGGFTGVSCDIMPSALRWQLSAIRWHCISFLSYLVLFGKHLTMLGGILTAGSNLSGEERSWGRDESVRRGAGSQWIVAARPLCHLQCPVAYLSRLQRIQPTARLEGSFEEAGHSTSAGPA